MAKVGEGDPRWLVEARQDGTNVNNWHWSEVDCFTWSKSKLATLIGDQIILDNDVAIIKTLPAVTVTGECSSMNRKGKTIFLFELTVKANWEGKLKSADGSTNDSPAIKGELILSGYDDESETKPTVSVTVSGDSNNTNTSDKLKLLVRSHGIPLFHSKLQQYIKELKETFTRTGTSTPPPSSNGTVQNNNDNKPTTTTTTTTTTNPQTSSSSSTATSTGGGDVAPSLKLTPKQSTNTKSLSIREEFQASPMDAYDIFINTDKIKAYTQSECVFENKEGGKFSLYGGFITGTNEKLVPGATIQQKWRLNSWTNSSHYSTVTINFSVGDKPVTNVEIVQTGIPAEEYEKTQEGWKRNILERIKMVFGYGSKIY